MRLEEGTAAQRHQGTRAGRSGAFTLVELLVVISVIGVLVSIMLPALGAAREAGRTAVCLSKQRQLVTGWAMYAGDFKGRCLPAGDERSAAPDVVYWFGAVSAGPPASVDQDRGFLSPYLESGLHEQSVYECPSQPWGSYRAQPAIIPAPGRPTSTYGYNGYELSPPMTPGWDESIGGQAWKRVSDVERPSLLLVFADTLLPVSPVRNDPLLDPPMLYTGNGTWETDPSPTTCFRHGPGRGGTGSAAGARADGSAAAVRGRREWIVAPECGVGSVGGGNDPCYVPDWRRWR